MEKAKRQLEILSRSCSEIIEEKELLEKLSQDRPLRIKFGADPSAPDIHLGHMVVLGKLRRFGELGHRIIFIIGDFTAMIGDPTGRLKTRPVLSEEEVRENSKTYQEQVFRILDRKYTEVVYNSSWLGKMGLKEILMLAETNTVSRMLERDDFKKRFRDNVPIRTSEFLYPLLQGWDSVHLKADVEVGGIDQKFNLLMGRTLQQKYGQRPQAVMMMPLLVGTDGEKKMSKSYGNYIGISDSPEDVFGKVMSISDELMKEWAGVLEFSGGDETGKLPPREGKALMAYNITEYLYSEKEAAAAREHFEKVVVKKGAPEVVPEFKVKGTMAAAALIYEAGACPSRSRAKQLIAQRAVSIDGRVIEDPREEISVRGETLLKVGKRTFIKLKEGK